MAKIIIFICIALSFFSYTQIDLNLTLVNWPPYLQFQQQLIQLGYYNRPVNGTIFLILFLFLITNYCILFTNYYIKSLDLKKTSKLILLSGIILTLGYTAFSHDLFNYIFDARIITQYGLNPYAHKALDFPRDEWIRFMQWTHRNYPYGPSWLLITIFPSILGLQKFLLTFLLFKLLFLSSYLACCYYIYKITSLLTTKNEQRILALVLFAFHPLVLIDGLLSPHLDITMAAFGLAGVYCSLCAVGVFEGKLLPRKQFLGWLLITISAGIKFATLPWLITSNSWFIRKYGQKTFLFSLFLFSILLTLAQAISQSNYQPWYGLLSAATLSLLTPYVKVKYLFIAGILLALPLSIYIAHIYTGEWYPAIPIFNLFAN